MRPVVFLDRDGTLNEEIGYITEVSKLALIDGAAEAVAKLNRQGIAAMLVTNQTGAARGYFEESHIVELNQRLCQLLESRHAFLDDVFYCPHLEGAPVARYAVKCGCRKPEPGMVEEAFGKHADLDRSRAYVVGDKATDVELAQRCGAKGILVQTGYGRAVQGGTYQWPVKPTYEASCIVDAVDWILADLTLTTSGSNTSG